AEVGEAELLRGEAAAAIVDGGPDAGIAEAHDIAFAATREIGEEARMLLDPPSLVVAEVAEHQARRREAAAGVVHRRPPARIPDAAGVGEPAMAGGRGGRGGRRAGHPRERHERPAQACDLDSVAGMLVGAPAAVVAEIADHRARREEPALSVAQR